MVRKVTKPKGKKYVYREKDHPRNIIGQWRLKNLGAGWHKATSSRGKVYHYYVGSTSPEAVYRLTGGQTNLLSRGTVGGATATQFSDEMEVVHFTRTDDNQYLAIAGSEHYAVGIVNHDQQPPEHDFRVTRNSQFEPVAGEFDEDENKYGYESHVDVADSERTNREVFNDPDALVQEVNPQELADEVARIRREEYVGHTYMEKNKQTGEEEAITVTPNRARNMPMFVYIDGKSGELKVERAYNVTKDGVLKRRHSPNSHGGSPVVRLNAADLTRITRAMDADGTRSVQVAVGSGTKQTKTGRRANNALFFRADGTTSKNEQITTWATLENNPEPTRREELTTAQREARRKDAIQRNLNPTTDDGRRALAAAVFDSKRPDRYYVPKKQQTEQHTVVGGAYRNVYRIDNKTGEINGMNITDVRGAVFEVQRQGYFVGAGRGAVQAAERKNGWVFHHGEEQLFIDHHGRINQL
ncbi:hypothetical protein GCM10007377_16210 [Galliscardovia ingluviei]|uniref:Uncharacterized protein n=1 Tax=Galliscardovia ingluviei TaxID=1769422 RepID=A0A8J3EXZ2_9BIFI|nr:hypothetical protein [Galliscardovia ingluviei]GGI15500.1 hypothetical protein GCM10007377_16210 [Galliscardovia ingluviei]